MATHATFSKKLSVMLSQLNAVKAKRQHVVVPILLLELYVKVFVNFVILLLVTV